MAQNRDAADLAEGKLFLDGNWRKVRDSQGVARIPRAWAK